MHNQIHPVPPGLADHLVRNEITEIIHPYLRYIEGWQLRMSYLRAQLATHPAGSDEHDLAEKRLLELLDEVDASRQYLVVETNRLPPDDRVDTTLDEIDGFLIAVRAAIGTQGA
ncbi:hypothetical protein [Devosia sp. CN2-171]|uniref:hypothetical protein n=1 Tax=Devosia sp. CN2-171 TaxID=3400909 RepID=UPI003BF8272D